MLSYLCGSACGLHIRYGLVSALGGKGAEWNTVSVHLNKDNDTNNHNYIYVSHFFHSEVICPVQIANSQSLKKKLFKEKVLLRLYS